MSEKKNRRYVGMRLQEDLMARVEAIASAQETTARSVIEQLAKVGLPELERLYVREKTKEKGKK
jgi:hypothetical protein